MQRTNSSVSLTRRQMLGAMSALALPQFAAAATTYPSGPVTLVVPFSAGGQFDTIGRTVANSMGSILGKPMIVENVGGAGGTIGGAKVVRSKPDGQTLLLYGGNLASARGLYPFLDYDPLADFQAISRLSMAPHVVMASPKSGITSFPNLLEKIKAGGKFSYGSPGVGTSMHLTFELIKQHYGIDILHVPYKGGSNVMNDLIAGNLDLGIIAIGPALGFIRGKKVQALGITSKARTPVAPEIPAFAELGMKTLDAGSWAGLSTPKGTPADVVKHLNQVAVQALASADVKRLFEEQGFVATPSTPQQMQEFSMQDAQMFIPVIKALQAKN